MDNNIKNEIKNYISEIESVEGLLNLMNYVLPHINKDYKTNLNPIKLNSLYYYANPEISKKRFKEYSLIKKNGEERLILAPVFPFKIILKTLDYILRCVHNSHAYSFGFEDNKTILDNAVLHLSKRFIYKIDLKDFFHSFDEKAVKNILQKPPFNFNGPKEKIAFLISKLCTHKVTINGETRSILPQGSPTSPILTNILCYKLDQRLYGLSKRFGVTYSRYADDITFSSNKNILKENEFLNELYRIINEYNIRKFNDKIITIGYKLEVNQKKIKLIPNFQRQTVTGVVVNQKLNVKKEFIKKVRMWLNYIERYGYEKSEKIFHKEQLEKNNYINQKSLKNYLNGMISHIAFVKGKENVCYIKLKERYETIFKTNKNTIKGNNSEKATESTSMHGIIKEKYPSENFVYKTKKFLENFSKNEILKYLTHEWDTEIISLGYEEFMTKVNKEWKKISFDCKNYNKTLHSKITNFIFNDKLGETKDAKKNNDKKKFKSDSKNFHYWGMYKLKFGWSSPKLKEYMSKNPNSNPFNFKIPPDIRKNEEIKELYSFHHYVNKFKEEIEFREDSNNFIQLLKKINSEFKFNLSGLDDLKVYSVYTNVENIYYALRRMFNMFKVYKEKYNNILIIQEDIRIDEKKFIQIKISQEDSHVDKNHDDSKFQNPGGDLKRIIEHLKNNADFSLAAKFADGNYYQINYLSTVKSKKFVEKISPVSGFTFILKLFVGNE